MYVLYQFHFGNRLHIFYDLYETILMKLIIFGLDQVRAQFFVNLKLYKQGRRNDFFLRGAHFIRKTKFC